MAPKRQVQSECKVLTLYGERAAYDTKDHNWAGIDSVVRGYAVMNETVIDTFRNATIHSVSYSNVILPEHGTVYRMWLCATVVYSGEPEPNPFEKDYQGMADDTVRRVYL